MDYKQIKTDYLESVSGGDITIISEITELFRSQAAEIYNDMKRLYDKKEYSLLGMLAHKAKSSVAIMGMDELASLLKKFELSAKEAKDTDLYPSYIEKFGKDTREAIEELDDFIAKQLNAR